MSPADVHLWEKVLAGDVRAASRLMRRVEEGDLGALQELRALFPHSGKAYVVGVTGPPGAGKSTLVDRLIAYFRERGKKVGVLAVDPTSPLTGGAILGDRIRMQAHSGDSGVFIRSMASRGHLGGLARVTADCVGILDAMGQEVILVETVGVGQAEVEVSQLVHTTVLVLVPGMGDDIQAIKAGILEVANVLVVNKADSAGADKLVSELRQMLGLRHIASSPTESPPSESPITKVVASLDEGVADVGDAIGRHREHLEKSGEKRLVDGKRAVNHLRLLLQETLLSAALTYLADRQGGLDEVASQMVEHHSDPYRLAEELAQRFSQRV